MKLSIIIPTVGRDTLADTLASIPDLRWVEIVVVADGEQARQRVLEQRGRTISLYETGPSVWGHPQRTLGMEKAAGDWLAFIDDDDVYTPAAFPAFRAAMGRRKPTLFRMRYQQTGLVLWNERQVAHCNVGTPMILTPNRPGKLGGWARKRTGDFDFIRDTVEGFGGCTFDETVVAEIR